MSRVLVVSRTRMRQGRVCVGGHDLDDGFRSLRLLTPGGRNLKAEAEIDVGEIWDLAYVDRPEPDPPHVEDVLVSTGKRLETLSATEAGSMILENENPWTGSPESVFDGTVAATPSGRLYIPGEGPVPKRSTGYWIPDDEVVKSIHFEKVKFLYIGGSDFNGFSWAGMAEPPNRIAAESLVRVSLTRWYDPESAPAGYYVQISGVY